MVAVNYGYAKEKLIDAVKTLTGPEPQWVRLREAATYNLSVLIPEQHLPEEVRGEFEKMWEAITRHSAQGEEGRLQATLSKLDYAEVEEHVKTVFGIFTKIAFLY
jgi:hypothetical protein